MSHYRSIFFALVAGLALALGAAACGDDNGGGGGGASPEAQELDQAAIDDFCSGEESYAESTFTDDDAKRLGCIFEMAFSMDPDPVQFCEDNFDDCVDDAEVEEDPDAEYACVLDEIDRTNCTATVAEIRACERSFVDEFVSFARDFECSDLGEEDENGEDLSPECQIVDDKCPQYFGGEVPNQTPNQTNQNGGPGGANSMVGEVVQVQIEEEDMYWADVYCPCEWEVDEYASEADCVADTTFGDAATVAACAQGVANDYEEAPAGVESYYNCELAAYDQLLECYDILTGVDVCDPSVQQNFGACEESGFTALSACGELLDEASEDWLEGLYGEVQVTCI